MRSKAKAAPYVLVFIGGAVGAGIRIGLGQWWVSDSTFPWPTFIVNITGAVLLGALYGLTSGTRSGQLRLLLGTGLLGGYTTYSTFAVGSDGLILSNHLLPGVLYAIPTVVIGIAGAFAAESLTRREAHA
ncbi:MAG: CrcB family protein [Microbacterium sp.]|nr:CrcB family protein [Microbacterium sp.]